MTVILAVISYNFFESQPLRYIVWNVFEGKYLSQRNSDLDCKLGNKTLTVFFLKFIVDIFTEIIKTETINCLYLFLVTHTTYGRF